MSKEYPSEQRLTFVLCEDIRQEIGNKLTFIGVFSGGDVIFSPKVENPVLAAVSFFFGFRDGEGTFEGGFDLKSPSGEPIIQEQDIGLMEKHRDRGMNFYATMYNFEATEFGEYIATLRLDDHAYEQRFWISQLSEEDAANANVH